MSGAILAAGAGSSAWSYGGAVLTFLFPMLLFLGVAGTLYVLYTKPLLVPGSGIARNRTMADTPAVIQPRSTEQTAAATAATTRSQEPGAEAVRPGTDDAGGSGPAGAP
jgi:hypothetical protein